MTFSEQMRIVTAEMADAWEDARPRRKGPYKDDADERQAHAEGNWLAMLDACEAYAAHASLIAALRRLASAEVMAPSDSNDWGGGASEFAARLAYARAALKAAGVEP